jgi:hypothetical protein
MTNPELGQQIVNALEQRLEKNFKRQMRIGQNKLEPRAVLDAVAEQGAAHIREQEKRYRDQGQHEVADAFQMVRKELWGDAVAEFAARVT